MTRRRPLLAAFTAVTSAIALGAVVATASPAGAAPGGGPAVRLALPSGWSKSAQADGRIALRGPGGAAGLVWPLFVPARLSDRAAGVALGQIARGYVGRGMTWGTPSAERPGVLVVRGSGGGQSGIAVLRYAVTKKATVATLFALAAPKAVAAAAAQQLAPAFASFRVAGAAAGGDAGGDAGIAYVSWSDPAEGAFRLEVPKGWTVKGGLVRKAAIDVRMGVALASPDQHVTILIGDSTLPTFAVPNAMLTAAGFTEGSDYALGQGVVQRVLHYIGGVDFAELYGATLAKAGSCTGSTILDKRSRPDTVAVLNRIQAQLQQVGANVRTDAGEVAFSCSIGKRPLSAYVFATTTLVTVGAVGTWWVPHLYVATADTAYMGEAEAVLRHVVGSFQQDASWTERQSNVTMASSRAAAASAQAISDSISSSYWSKAASEDRLSEQRSDATLGLTNTVDPVTGDPFKVSSSSTYHWIDHSGNIVGTDVSTAPSTDFRQLLDVRR